MSDSATSRETIGFIGIGFMGHGMAKNILGKGYPLTFLGRANRPPAEDLKERGGVEVASAKDVAERASVIFLCVTGSAEVESIMNGANGLKAGLKQAPSSSTVLRRTRILPSRSLGRSTRSASIMQTLRWAARPRKLRPESFTRWWGRRNQFSPGCNRFSRHGRPAPCISAKSATVTE